MVVRFQQLLLLFALVFGSASFSAAQLSSNFACATGHCASSPGHAIAPVSTYEVGSSWQWTPNASAHQHRQVAATYNRYCVRCHGVDGRGVWDVPDVPNFADPAWQSSRTDEQLARLTIEGRGAVMPAFRGTLTWNESLALAGYIRELAYQKPSRSYRYQPTFQPLQTYAPQQTHVPEQTYVPQQTYVPAETKFPTSHPTFSQPKLFTPVIDTPTISSPTVVDDKPKSDFDTPPANDEPGEEDSMGADAPAYGRDSEFSPPTESTQPPTDMADEPMAEVTDEQLDEYFDETPSGRSTEIPDQPVEELPAPEYLDEKPKMPNLPNPSYDLQSPALELQSPVLELQPPPAISSPLDIQLQSYPIAGRYPAPPIRPRTVPAKPPIFPPARTVPDYPNSAPPGAFPPVKVNVTPPTHP